MAELALLALVIGDWFFINRENVLFAFECELNLWR